MKTNALKSANLLSFTMVLLLATSGYAGMACVDLFSAPQKELSSSSEMSEFKTAVEVAKTNLTDAELGQLRADALKFDERLRYLETRIRIYSELTGSEIGRSAVEANSYARKIKYKLRAGLIDQVTQQISTVMKRYEVDMILSHKLSVEIKNIENKIKQNPSAKNISTLKRIIKGKKSEKEIYDRHIGRNHYKYIALKSMIEEMAASKNENHSFNARRLLSVLRDVTEAHALKFNLKYNGLSLAQIKKFVEANLTAQKALLSKAAWEEAWLAFKIMTFSAPIVKVVKSVIYKIPANIQLKAFSFSPRDLVSEAFGVGYNQHIRDVYLENIEAIIDAETPVEKYNLMRSLNVESERADELMVIFARITENTVEWEAIKSVAATKATESKQYEQFYERVMKADEQALKQKDFPLYYQEPGATAIGKLVLGGYVGVYYANQYIQSHPELVESVVTTIRQIIN